jgi:hypothetical protein
MRLKQIVSSGVKDAVDGAGVTAAANAESKLKLMLGLIESLKLNISRIFVSRSSGSMEHKTILSHNRRRGTLL